MDWSTDLLFQKFCTYLQCYSNWIVKYAFIYCSIGVQKYCKKTLVKCRKTQNFYKLIAKVQRNLPQCSLTKDKHLKFHELLMATKKILIAGVGGLARSPTDCKDSSLDLLDGPPMFVSALKGGYPLVSLR